MADNEPDPAPPTPDIAEPRREQFEKFRHDLATFIRLEVQLEAGAREPQLRRVGGDAVGALAVIVAVVSAFVLVNVAALLAITTVLPGWAAALILAGMWIVVGAICGAVLTSHAAPVIRSLRGDGSGSPAELRAARDRAWRDVQTDLATLAPPLTERAIAITAPFAARVAMSMATDLAGNLTGVVEEAEDIGRELAQDSGEVVETVVAEIPGGTIASTVWDLALLPGRTGVRMVTTVLKRPPPGE